MGSSRSMMNHGSSAKGCFEQVCHELIAMSRKHELAKDRAADVGSAAKGLELMQVHDDEKTGSSTSGFEATLNPSEKEPKVPKKILATEAGWRTRNSFLVELLKGCFRNGKESRCMFLEEMKDRSYELGYKLSYLLARFLFLVSLKEPEKEVITTLVKFGSSVNSLVADDDDQNCVVIDKITTVLKMTFKELTDRNELTHDRIIDEEFKVLIEFYGVDKVLDRFVAQVHSLNAIMCSPNANVPLSLVEPGLNHCQRKLIGLEVLIQTLELYGNCTQESGNVSANVQQKIQFLWSEDVQLSSTGFMSVETEEEWSRMMDDQKKLETDGPEDS